MQHEDFIPLKKRFNQKWKFAENILILSSIQYIDEFVSSSEQIWSNVESHHLLTNESSAVNGCRQNESQTADKNITIHTTPVHQLTS